MIWQVYHAKFMSDSHCFHRENFRTAYNEF